MSLLWLQATILPTISSLAMAGNSLVWLMEDLEVHKQRAAELLHNIFGDKHAFRMSSFATRRISEPGKGRGKQ